MKRENNYSILRENKKIKFDIAAHRKKQKNNEQLKNFIEAIADGNVEDAIGTIDNPDFNPNYPVAEIDEESLDKAGIDNGCNAMIIVVASDVIDQVRKEQLIDALIEKGCDLYYRDLAGFTAIDWADNIGNDEIKDYLISKLPDDDFEQSEESSLQNVF